MPELIKASVLGAAGSYWLEANSFHCPWAACWCPLHGPVLSRCHIATCKSNCCKQNWCHVSCPAPLTSGSQLLEECHSARQLVAQNLSAVLSALAKGLQFQAELNTPWTLQRQQHLHMLSKVSHCTITGGATCAVDHFILAWLRPTPSLFPCQWVLQLAQHLSPLVSQLVWETVDKEKNADNRDSLTTILSALLTLLLTKVSSLFICWCLLWLFVVFCQAIDHWPSQQCYC